MATLAIAVAGALVGGALGGPTGASIGWALGAALGSALFPQKIEGPRLTDLKLQNSQYGGMIPIVYGTIRIAGNVIWQTDLVEHEQKSGGKGGPEVTNYAYSASFAIRLCEGPVDLISKVWADGRLVYDGSQQYADWPMTVYLGTEQQLPDPTMEADLGAGNVPAYRGICYVVFEDLYLTDYGNRIPVFTFEVTTNGTPPEIPQLVGTFHAFPHNVSSAVCSATMDANGVIEVCEYQAGRLPLHYWEATYDLYGTVLSGPTDLGAVEHLQGYFASEGLLAQVVNGPWAMFLNTTGTGGDNVAWYYRGNIVQMVSWKDHQYSILGSGASCLIQRGIHQNGALYMPVRISGLGLSRWDLIEDAVPQPTATTAIAFNIPGANVSNIAVGTSDTGHVYVLHTASDAGFDGTYALFELDPDLNITRRWLNEELPAFNRSADFFVVNNMLVVDSGSGMGQKYVLVYDLDDFSLIGSMEVPGATGTFLLGSQIYLGDCYAINAWCTYKICDSAAGSGVPLSLIVGDLSRRAGMSSNQYDVIELTDIVHGFVVSSQAPARNSIEPLQPPYAFDGVESGDVVRFVKRGKEPVATIPDADLAAHLYGDAPPAELTHKRVQETELPRVTSVNYLNVGADYQKGTQLAQRQITSSTEVRSFDIPVALSDGDARAMAELILYDAWMGRDKFEFVTSRKWLALEPTDVVTVQGEPIRLVEKTEVARGLLQFRGEKAGFGIYVQATVPAASGGYTPPSGPPVVTPAQATDLALLDIPYIQTTSQQNVYWAAMSGAERTAWKGATLFVSDDDVNYVSIATATASSTIGAATTLLGWHGGGNVVDESNSVTVQLALGAGTLASVTLTQMLNGMNEAALGAEVFQYRDADLVGERTYRLSGLLRGRRGTEWAMATHVVGDVFVKLPVATSVATDDWGLDRYYRAVTSGRTVDTADTVDFTPRGAALTPYSPVELTTGKNAAGDFLLAWKRRTRYGGDWKPYVDVPLAEEAESYQVLVWADETYASAVWNAAVDAAEYTFTAADQTTALGAPQSVLYWSVAQWGALGPGTDSLGQSPVLTVPPPEAAPSPTPLGDLPDLGAEMHAGFALSTNFMQNAHANFAYLASLHLNWAYAYACVSASGGLRDDLLTDLDAYAGAGAGLATLETFRGVRYQGSAAMCVPWGCSVAPGPTLRATHPRADIALPYPDDAFVSPRVVPLLGAEAVVEQGIAEGGKNYSQLIGQAATVQRGSVADVLDVYWLDAGSRVALSNANLTAEDDGLGTGLRVRANVGHTQGKYYFEVVADVVAPGSNTPEVGLLRADMTVEAGIWNGSPVVGLAGGLGIWTSISGPSAYASDGFQTGNFMVTHTWVNGDIFQVAVDFDAGYIWFGLNGTWVQSGNPSAGTNPVFTTVHGRGPLYPAAKIGSVGGKVTAHFAPEDFAYTPPTDFNPWRTGSGSGVYADGTQLSVTVSRGAFTKDRSVTLSGQQATSAGGDLTPA